MSEMLTYLQQTSAFVDRLVPAGVTTARQLLIQNGRPFTTGPATFAGKLGQPKQCYMNAGRLALRNPKLIYVEGMITAFSLPIEHAWVVHRDTMEVIDPTLRPKEPGCYANYFGIPFSTAYLREVTHRTGYWGLISHTNPGIFTKDQPKDFVHV